MSQMRRPFIWCLILLSLYCWLKDVVEFLFYLWAGRGDSAAGFPVASVVAALGVLVFLCILRATVYRDAHLRNLFQVRRRGEWLALFLVALPIVWLGLFRSLYPDQNFDTLHFELYLQDYKLSENKINFAAGSIRTYYFPLSERIFGWCRHLLGYRLGTLMDTFLLTAIIASGYDFLRRFFSTWCPGIKTPVIGVALLSLFAAFADNALFNIASYKPDLIGVPILMELLYIVCFDKRERKTSGHLAFFGLVSLAIAYKLTYLPYAAVLAAVYYCRYVRQCMLYPLFILLVPSVYLLYNFMETGSPIFPFYNKVFHSALYPDSNFKDMSFGPRKCYEVFIFPIVTWLDPGRSNVWRLFSYRLLAGYLIAPLIMVWCLVRRKSEPIARPLFFVALIAFGFDFLCIVTTGYYRYGIIVEVVYGLLISAAYLRFRRTWAGYLLLAVIIGQSYDTYQNIFVQQKNLSLYDYAALEKDGRRIRQNAALLGRDYDQIRDPDSVLSRVDAFVDVAPCPEDGVAKLLNPHVPIYDLLNYSRTWEVMTRFEQDSVRGASETRNFETVTNGYNLNATFAQLSEQGYLVTEVHQVYPRFMRAGEPVFLLRIRYLDTSRYTIRYAWQNIGDDSPGADRKDFSYGPSDPLNAFVMETFYTFDWPSSVKAGEFSLNGHTFVLRDPEAWNRIYPVTGRQLRFIKSTDNPFTMIIQEIKEKK